ncbi:HutD family protein [Streptomyces sp. NBC_00249]|uniref:HutD/Ves family protein n=1 Tax=Streptomyces sp. NBC_00249 TaxID=2975690 RepID=UPI0022579B68|nr:HutD family protein [Streptomyces sp. NBC_00249]MCX5192608.1 HutD family protein [Streptomyces sp. NBC_00249]
MTSPAGIRILRAADRAAVPWKNGGGVTREIAARPEDAGTADFAWRVSLAEVAADGPFSEFPGVDRTLTLAEGAGMDLTVGEEHRRVDERYAPRHFPGDLPTGCRLLGGPVVNFNVMWRRERAGARTAVVRGELGLDVRPDETLLLVALDGPALLTGPGGEGAPVELSPYDAALVTEPLSCAVRTGGRVAVVRLTDR